MTHTLSPALLTGYQHQIITLQITLQTLHSVREAPGVTVSNLPAQLRRVSSDVATSSYTKLFLRRLTAYSSICYSHHVTTSPFPSSSSNLTTNRQTAEVRRNYGLDSSSLAAADGNRGHYCHRHRQPAARQEAAVGANISLMLAWVCLFVFRL